MKKLLSILLLICLVYKPAFAQKGKVTWSRVKVLLNAENTMKKLSSTGVETDHGQLKPGYWFISDFSTAEIKRITDAGFETSILIPDVQADFILKNAGKSNEKSVQTDYFDPSCNGTGKYRIPQNWTYGSMGGHLTYKEMLNHLDSMKAKYPALISVRTPVDSLKTENDSSIWYVRITDQPLITEAEEPKGLFTAVHHAREPVGMHQLIFFMWYLLENYQTNNEIKNLVNNSDLFFIPCLNPDGYLYNQESNPQGGGMWRKNRAKNVDNTFGVDLNRNYGYRWGIDDFGSSPEPSSDVYRGPEAFSEPETKSIRKFCETHQFKLALNYHTFGNFLLNPWGYDGSVANEDSVKFRQLASELTKENNFRSGTCLETLNYNSNGSSDDYMYAENPQKPEILAFTPEVGNEFWPTQDKILPLCLKTIHQNLAAVRALHPMISISDSTGVFHHPGYTTTIGPPRLVYRLSRIGANDNPGTVFSVTFTPFGFGTEGLSPVTKTYQNLVSGQTLYDSILLPPTDLAIINPDLVSWAVSIDNQIFQTEDTLFHYGGYPYSDDNLAENCDNVNSWSGSWVVSGDSPQEGSGFLKSTEGEYGPDLRLYMARRRPFDLRSSNIRSAEMSFWTKFRVEKNFDLASLQFSTDSGASWIPVCTDKTKPSSPFSNQAGVDDNGQDTITPVWDGIQNSWRREFVDLKDYLGNKLWIRFYFKSDGAAGDYGFAVDNIRIRIANILTAVPETMGHGQMSISIRPNPTDGASEIRIAGLKPGKEAKLIIRDAAGRILHESLVSEEYVRLPSISLKAGCYFLEVKDDTGRTARSKLLYR
jgi:hypothetical protein